MTWLQQQRIPFLSRICTWASSLFATWTLPLRNRRLASPIPVGLIPDVADSDWPTLDWANPDWANPDWANPDWANPDWRKNRAQGLWQGTWNDGIREASHREAFQGKRKACESNYWASSTASADTLWQIVSNLADLSSWHPLITSTNAPRGLRAKPGLIYRAVSRHLPLSTQIFVERVLPGELLSVRLFPLPGLQERVTYRIVSTLCGTCVLYSITLSGWLSPLAWPVVRPQATRVAAALVEAAEQTGASASSNSGVFTKRKMSDRKTSHHKTTGRAGGKTDIFGSPL
jgi:hypothetical protein